MFVVSWCWCWCWCWCCFWHLLDWMLGQSNDSVLFVLVSFFLFLSALFSSLYMCWDVIFTCNVCLSFYLFIFLYFYLDISFVCVLTLHECHDIWISRLNSALLFFFFLSSFSLIFFSCASLSKLSLLCLSVCLACVLFCVCCLFCVLVWIDAAAAPLSFSVVVVVFSLFLFSCFSSGSLVLSFYTCLKLCVFVSFLCFSYCIYVSLYYLFVLSNFKFIPSFVRVFLCVYVCVCACLSDTFTNSQRTSPLCVTFLVLVFMMVAAINFDCST